MDNKVNFGMLVELTQEADMYGSTWGIDEVIEILAMDDVPLTSAVIKLGVAMGVLDPGYKCGWSIEEGEA